MLAKKYNKASLYDYYQCREYVMRKYQVAIFRHAKADVAPNEMSRPLTNEGVSQALNVAKRILPHWQILLCSPAIRTQQTGQYISNLAPIVIERLYTNHSPLTNEIELLYKEIMPYTLKGHCMIITHQPIILPLIYCFTQKPSIDVNLKTCEGAILLENGSIQWIQR